MSSYGWFALRGSWLLFGVEPKGVSQMGMTINRRYRDALYDGLMTDLTAHSERD
jgi:hypothetical protein